MDSDFYKNIQSPLCKTNIPLGMSIKPKEEMNVIYLKEDIFVRDFINNVEK